jgi:outer membrane protein assembly factor BamB
MFPNSGARDNFLYAIDFQHGRVMWRWEATSPIIAAASFDPFLQPNVGLKGPNKGLKGPNKRLKGPKEGLKGPHEGLKGLNVGPVEQLQQTIRDPLTDSGKDETTSNQLSSGGGGRELVCVCGSKGDVVVLSTSNKLPDSAHDERHVIVGANTSVSTATPVATNLGNTSVEIGNQSSNVVGKDNNDDDKYQPVRPSRLWATSQGGKTFSHQSHAPFSEDNSLLKGSQRGSTRSQEGTQVSIHKLASVQLGGDVFSSPVMIGGRVFVGCRDDHIYCLKFVELV